WRPAATAPRPPHGLPAVTASLRSPTRRRAAPRPPTPLPPRGAPAEHRVRILLSGYYGFANLGDEAILAGLARELGRRGHEVTALAAEPVATAAGHGVVAVHRTRGLVGALLRSDALVSGGGGLLQDATSARSLAYYLGVLRAARLLGKRAAVYGQSLGPLTPAG